VNVDSVTAPGLEVRGLCAGYGRLPIVVDFDLDVQTAELVALLGRNGAGKSTALLAMGGLRYGGNRGSVRIGGREVGDADAPGVIQAGLALVPEGRRIFGDLTVEQNLRIGAFPRRRHIGSGLRDELDRITALFPVLGRDAKRAAFTLSGGEQQMLAIGQALMSKPLFLLLDEPMAGVAPALADEIYDRLRLLCEEGVGALVVEQNVERALAVSDRYYVMDNGSIAAAGSSRDALAEAAVNRIVMAVPNELIE
jgi:branched-chain amino acid transport system ATP-binding protein